MTNHIYILSDIETDVKETARLLSEYKGVPCIWAKPTADDIAQLQKKPCSVVALLGSEKLDRGILEELKATGKIVYTAHGKNQVVDEIVARYDRGEITKDELNHLKNTVAKMQKEYAQIADVP